MQHITALIKALICVWWYSGILLLNKKRKTMEKIYKEIKKDGKTFVVFDKLQAIANIYEYNKKLGANY